MAASEVPPGTDESREGQPQDDAPGGATQAPASGRPNPLRPSPTSRLWASVVVLVVVLLLLVIFVAQNTGRVTIAFLGWRGHPSLAVAILAAVVAGMALAVTIGTLRLWQVRRRVKGSG
jgi:uncharacterized integral membrane protein